MKMNSIAERRNPLNPPSLEELTVQKLFHSQNTNLKAKLRASEQRNKALAHDNEELRAQQMEPYSPTEHTRTIQNINLEFQQANFIPSDEEGNSVQDRTTSSTREWGIAELQLDELKSQVDSMKGKFTQQMVNRMV